MLTELQRRAIANLSIPRNVDNLAQHVNPYATVTPDDLDKLLKGELSENGWVVKLGESSDPAKLASKVQGTKAALDLPDDKAEIYARRMTRADLSWRLSGDLWMLTGEGLNALKEPLPNERTMTLTETQAAVDAEWARVLGEEFKPGEHSLANALLEDEFKTWYTLVADECERVWGERPKAPMAGGASGYSDAYETALIDAENQKVALGAVVDPWYMTLSILGFTDADTGTTADDGSHKPTYTGYARKSVAGTDMASAASPGGSSINANSIILPACTAGSSTVVGFGNTSASTAGTLRKWGDCTSTGVSTTQTPAQFVAGAYTTTTN